MNFSCGKPGENHAFQATFDHGGRLQDGCGATAAIAGQGGATSLSRGPCEARGLVSRRFLEYIGHPQRIFNIDDGGYFWEKETAVPICADKTRFPEMLRQLNCRNDLDIKAKMPLLRQTG
jgi:hypothetical protein